jgi:NitT/TauT family transport system substrate-binding protein
MTRHHAWALRFVTGAILLAACSAERAPRDVAFARDTVRVGYQRYLSYAPLFIAEAENFFAEQGIALEMVVMPDGGAGTPLIVAGRIDVLAGTGTPGLLNAIAAGANVRLVADKGSIPTEGCSQLALVGRPGIDLAARSGPAMLRRVSPSRAVPAFDFFVDRTLADAHVDTSSIEVLHLSTTIHGETLASAQIDAVATTEPAVARLVDAGNRVLRDAREVVPGLPYGFIVYGDRIRANDDLAVRFMVAYLRGVRRYADGRTPRNLEIITAATGDEAALLARTCWASFRETGIDTAAFLEFQRWSVRRGLLDRVLSTSEYWDGSFASQAVARLDARDSARAP